MAAKNPILLQMTAVIRWLGSLKLAVILLLTLATVIAVATVLEAKHGRDYALWHVYHSQWFVVLLVLLGVNIFAAALSRWPWKRHHTGFVVTHLGLLVLLTGAVQSFVGGVDGQVTIAEGESAQAMIVPQRTQISATWQGKPEEAPYLFTFEPGPTDWGASTTLDLGDVDGVAMRVLRYISHANAKEDWVPDETALGGAALKFKVESPHGGGSEEHLLVDQDFGDEVFVGPIRVQLRRATSKAMLDDFLKPPAKLGKKGLLLAYFDDQVKHIAVEESQGKKVILNEAGLAVEIVDYLANAKPTMHHEFRSAGTEPRNPLLELRVHEPGKKPMRQLAFAKSPLLTLDPMLGQTCPVKFHYLHPGLKSETAVEFLQSGDDLFCRLITAKQVLPQGKVSAGARIPMPGNFSLSLGQYTAHARQKIAFELQETNVNPKDKAEAAAEVEVTVGSVTRTVWVQRNHPIYGTRAILTPNGILMVRLGHAETPLGFSLKLVEFRKDVNPGGVGNAAFSSAVRIVDEANGIEEDRVISMNEPLKHGGLTFYQSGFNDSGHGVKTSTFSVGRDPGRALKYSGSLLVCLGIAVMFYMRAYFFKRTAAPKESLVIDQKIKTKNPEVEPETLAKDNDPALALSTQGRDS